MILNCTATAKLDHLPIAPVATNKKQNNYIQPDGTLVSMKECVCGPYSDRDCPVIAHKQRAKAEKTAWGGLYYIRRLKKQREWLAEREVK